MKPAKFTLSSPEIATTSIWLPFTSDNVSTVCRRFARRIAKERYGLKSYYRLIDVYPSNIIGNRYHAEILIGNRKDYRRLVIEIDYVLPR